MKNKLVLVLKVLSQACAADMFKQIGHHLAETKKQRKI
jgi:hypothetical protein